MGQVFVPTQAAAFATISPEAIGKASTMFNAARQVGGAIGVALLTTSRRYHPHWPTHAIARVWHHPAARPDEQAAA